MFTEPRSAMGVLLWCVVLAAAAAARELDPAACAARFDVQRDKIIRTEESRAMGARYLAELDVGARAECLRLCCETDSCDVFVYEEKSPGSCYLFACGPPEDFRCKFTAHGNFSSGVLAVARRRAEEQDRARLALHEQQLASLRSATVPTPAPTSSTTPSTPATHAPPPTPPPTLAPPPPPPRRCSRYQFECHSGGECVAVYNACDGVPQCADGSDEAPELGCPPATRAPEPRPPPDQVLASRAGVPQCADGSDEAPELGCPPATRAPEPRPPPDQPAAASAEGGAGERWPHRLAQAQPHRYPANNEAGGSHIFSHKGGLLAAPAPYEPAWPRAPWAPPQTGMEGAWGYGRPEWPEPEARRGWPVPQPRPDPDIPEYVPQKTMPELPLAYGGQHTLRDAPKKGPAPAPPAPPAPPKEEIAPSPAAHEPAKAAAAAGAGAGAGVAAGAGAGVAAGAGAVVTAGAGAGVAAGAGAGPPAPAPRLPAGERDGLSDRPPAAVLLLVLGVLMTASMLALAGCRARAARRRLRRGKSPFAHDADYLVNGMYL